MARSTSAEAREPLICLTHKQRQKLTEALQGMTLTGAMALAIKDEGKFKAIYDRQQAIIQALGVLGIKVEVGQP